MLILPHAHGGCPTPPPASGSHMYTKPTYEIMQHLASLVSGRAPLGRLSFVIALFPGPAQLLVTCSMEKQGEPGIFSHMMNMM